MSDFRYLEEVCSHTKESHDVPYDNFTLTITIEHTVLRRNEIQGMLSFRHVYKLSHQEKACKPSNNPAENSSTDPIDKILEEKHIPLQEKIKFKSDLFRYLCHRDLTSKRESMGSSGNSGSGSLQSQPRASNSQNADNHSRQTNVAAKRTPIFFPSKRKILGRSGNSRSGSLQSQPCTSNSRNADNHSRQTSVAAKEPQIFFPCTKRPAVKSACSPPQVPSLPLPKTSHPFAAIFGDFVFAKKSLDGASTYKSRVPAFCQPLEFPALCQRFVDEESFPACWEFHSLAQAMDDFMPEPEGPPPSPSSNPQGPVMMVYELNREKVNCDKLFNIFCLYGNIVKIKFLNCKEGCAMIQMDDPISVERAVSNLNGYAIFHSKLKLGFSKQAFLNDVPQPFTLPDGTPSFKDYTGNINHRFTNPEAASMNTIRRPLKLLHFFNAPFSITEDEMKKVFEDNKAAPPRSVKLFTFKHKSESSSGLVEFNTVSESLEGLALCNHVSISNTSGKFPQVLKLCFSSTGSSGCGRVCFRGY